MDEFTFDFDFWLKKYPLSNIPQESWYAWDLASSCYPPNIPIMEQIRSELSNTYNMGETVPCDVFCLGIGEPSRRDVTKINGLPYRPADLSWPTGSENGKPMTFLAQFRFSESTDILPKLPGDILLIFARDNWIARDSGCFYFEWYPSGLTNLIPAKDVPEPDWEFINCYGVRHRSIDFLDRDFNATEAVETLHPDGIREDAVNRAMSSLVCWNTLKIGGIPHFFTSDADHLKSLREDIPGHFLCSIPVIGPHVDEPDPWINRSEPLHLKHTIPPDDLCLYFWDGFILLFSVDDCGDVHWTIDLG